MPSLNRLRPSARLALGLGLLAPSSAPGADPASPARVALDALVVSATRTERALDETPGTVTATDLRDFAVATLADTVRGETLVSVPFTFSGAGNAYGRSGANSLNIRGVEGNRVLLQVDGVRLPDEFRLGGSEPVGRDYLDPELYRRLEILHGSASALYGSDALGGVVTFTTKSPEDFGLPSERPVSSGLKLGYRTVDAGWHAAVHTAAAAGPLSALVVYARRKGRERENRGTVAPNPEDYTSDALLTKLVWSLAPAHRLELAAEWFDRTHFADAANREGPGMVGTTVENNVASDTERFRLSAAWRFTPEPGRRSLFDELDARLYLQDSVARDIAVERLLIDPPSAANGSFRDRLISTAFHNDTIGATLAAVKRAGRSHRLAYGVEVSATETGKPWTGIVTNSRGTSLPDEQRMADTTTTRLGAYLQHEADWTNARGRRFAVIPGLRVDRFKLTPDNSPSYLAATAGTPAPTFDEVAVTPKLGVLVGLTETLNGYAQYNGGFRYPSAEDLTATFTNPVARYRTLPNPNLRAETSNAYEAGLKGRAFPGVSVTTAAFYTSYDDFIEQIAFAPPAFQDFVNWRSGTFMTQNRSDARIYGAELRTHIALGEIVDSLQGWSLSASVGHSKGTFIGDDGERTRLASVEPMKATANLAYDARNGRWGASLFAEAAQGGRPGAATQFYAPGYTVFDAHAYWNLHDNLSLSLGLYNLTDRRHWRYGSVRGVTTTNLNEQERRSQPGFNAAFAAAVRF